VILLVIALSPTAHRWIRVQNMSPIIGVLIAASVLSILSRHDVRSALCLWLGTVAKYATAVLIPLYIATRRWKALVLLVVLGAATLAVSLAVMGRAPFDEYFKVIAPALNRTNEIPENQGVQGLLVRLLQTDGLPTRAMLAVNIAQVVVMLGILMLIFRCPPSYWREPIHLFAAASALVCWLLLFSPIFWEHYTAYLAPFWGWLAYEFANPARSRVRRWSAAASIALSLAPLTVAVRQAMGKQIPEPFGEHQLLATLLMLAIAVATLLDKPVVQTRSA
jgi:hypothetical protein